MQEIQHRAQFLLPLEAAYPMHSTFARANGNRSWLTKGSPISFLKIMSPVSGGGVVTNYSPRFSLTGMTGTFSPTVLAGIKAAPGTDGPPTEKPEGAAPGANVPSASYAIPFASQSGQIFYAPMQRRPGTKITAKTISPAYPTSSFSLAKSILPPPVPTTTITASMTMSTDSHAHTVCI